MFTDVSSLQLPAASTLVALSLAPLVAWRVYVRFRRASGRQRLSRYRAPISLSIYATLIALVGFANRAHPLNLLAFAAALLLGALLGAYALRHTCFEPTKQGLFYTPHGPIGLCIAVLFVARLAYRVVEVYVLDPADNGAAQFARSPLTLAAFGLMAGYYGWYMLGLLRWRLGVMRAKCEREVRLRDAVALEDAGGTMKTFVLIFRMDITTEAARPSPAQMQGYMVQWTAWTDSIAAVGRLAPGGNHLARSGKVLRAHDAVTDGPWTANGESVAGYLVIRAPDLDDAVRVARGCPILAGEGTSVEVREAQAPGS
jgi:hypothetical protein